MATTPNQLTAQSVARCFAIAAGMAYEAGENMIYPQDHESQASVQSRSVPRWAMFRGRRVRVAFYEGQNYFRVVDINDSTVSVHRRNLTFLSR